MGAPLHLDQDQRGGGHWIQDSISFKIKFKRKGGQWIQDSSSFEVEPTGGALDPGFPFISNRTSKGEWPLDPGSPIHLEWDQRGGWAWHPGSPLHSFHFE